MGTEFVFDQHAFGTECIADKYVGITIIDAYAMRIDLALAL